MKTENEILQGILNLLNGTDLHYKPMNLGSITMLRNNDFCSAILKTDDEKLRFQSIAHQFEFTEYLGTFDNIVMYKRPYEKMLNKEVDTKAHAKAKGLKPVNQFLDTKASFESNYQNENEQIEKFNRELQKKGIATFSETWCNRIIEKFPNSENQNVKAAFRIRESKHKKN